MTHRLAFAALTATLALSTPLAAQSLTGSYTAQGRNPDGSAYTGTVEIVENGGAVSITWTVGNSYAGAGTIDGKLITVQWGSDHPLYYVITPSGELHGTWGNGTALERLIPMR
ncbi:LIC10280 family protein [Vannielia litorea]|uniref:Fibronectin-binding protein n=1 Tax=Vannielia litorea TaxID=1217970 RepID=A0A1N6H0K4_9RHOB|nr:hypothetical protein [Vannielia litorea]SIO13323.1 hypothetical protein SAMN05444002_2967 [Vannielia litorea]